MATTAGMLASTLLDKKHPSTMFATNATHKPPSRKELTAPVSKVFGDITAATIDQANTRGFFTNDAATGTKIAKTNGDWRGDIIGDLGGGHVIGDIDFDKRWGDVKGDIGTDKKQVGVGMMQ
jgi:hypothetical protein